MGKVKSELTIENENLFRSLVCLPIAILFTMLAINSVMTSGIMLFQLIFILMALYFSLSTLSYAAHYTNERYEGKAAPIFNNKNLSKTMTFLPFAILSVFVAEMSVTSTTHIVFQTVFALIAIYTVLSALAYTAFYTNDCYEENIG